MKEIIHLSNEEEEIASDMDFWRPIDILLIGEILWMANYGKSLKVENIHMQLNEYHISEREVIDTIRRLGRKELLNISVGLFDVEGLPEILGVDLKASSAIMHLPENWKAMPREPFIDIMYQRMENAYKRIIAWKEVRKAPREVERTKKEIEDIKEELKKSQSEMLRNMIGIFGIFIAIFSFIVIGANTALSIQPIGYFAVGIILGIFLLIALVIAFLLYMIKKWFVKE